MASIPAPLAAASTWTRAKCQKSPGYSLTGSKLPSTRERSEAERSPAPKMIASSRSLARAISAALREPFGLLDQDLEPDARGEPQLGLELGEEYVHPPDVTRRAGLGHDEHVHRLPGPRDHLDDVAVAPRRLDPVHPDGPDGPAPVAARQRGDSDGPGRLLDHRGAGVLEVQEHEIGVRSGRPSRTSARCWPVSPAPIVAPSAVALLPPSESPSDHARRARGRPDGRRRFRAAHRRPRRCRPPGRGRGA